MKSKIMGKTRKLLSVLLTLALIGLVPVAPAFAGEETDVQEQAGTVVPSEALIVPTVEFGEIERTHPASFRAQVTIRFAQPQPDFRQKNPQIAYEVTESGGGGAVLATGTGTDFSWNGEQYIEYSVYFSGNLSSTDYSARTLSVTLTADGIQTTVVAATLPAWPSAPEGTFSGPGLWGIGSGGAWGKTYVAFNQRGGTLSGVSQVRFVLAGYPATIGDYSTNYEGFKGNTNYLYAVLSEDNGWDTTAIPLSCTQVGTTVTMTVDLTALPDSITLTSNTILYLEYFYIPRWQGEITASVYFDQTLAASKKLQGGLPEIRYPRTGDATYVKGSGVDLVADIHAATQADSYDDYGVLLGVPEVMDNFLYTYIGEFTEGAVREEGNGFWRIDANAARGAIQRTASNTVVTVTSGFLDSLVPGSYVLRVHYQDAATGFYDIALTIKAPTDTSWPRLDGNKGDSGTRFDTMQAIVETGWKDTGSDYVVVAYGHDFPDALAASSLAGIYDAPVVLTDKDRLTDQARATITGLNAKKAYIIGGDAVVSEEVEGSLAELLGGTANVERIAGENRFATALDIYREGSESTGGWGDTAIIANGFNFADALSVSPYANVMHYPIFLSTPDTRPESGLDADTIAAINSGGFKKVIITGGTAAVPGIVEEQLISSGLTIERWMGDNRYETSVDIIEKSLQFSGGALTLNNIICATGFNYPDALAGGAFAGHIGSVLLLIDDGSVREGGYAGLERIIRPHASEIGQGYVLGGEGALPKELLDLLQSGSKS
ncbi:MAG: cell wall-binding repeat-containing protein [Coriobacteriales bacterium]|nr:cell wall-binding repeat-containing protein [Coriobacteriales bacterium]